MDDDDLGVEVEDVEFDSSDPVNKMPKYIPQCKGNTKESKDIDESKVSLHIPLMSNQIVFEGPCLGWVPLLKLEDW